MSSLLLDNSAKTEHSEKSGTRNHIVVKLTDISKTYGFTFALKKVNLQISEGEVIGFLGDNGAGKSTLIKIISLLVKPTSGKVELFESEVSENRHLLKKELGALLSHSFFYDDMTGRENLEFYLRMLAKAGSPEEIVERASKQYKLHLYLDRPVHELSTGMAKKLEILRVILPTPPRLLLLDEPFAGLDVENRKFLDNLIIDKLPKTTVIIASHDFRAVSQLCDRVFYLEKGRIQRILDPSEYDFFLSKAN
ncbi:MAG: ATP-binding cassette domain-containing protein [Candidatus Hodarchaeota archaeon]